MQMRAPSAAFAFAAALVCLASAVDAQRRGAERKRAESQRAEAKGDAQDSAADGKRKDTIVKTDGSRLGNVVVVEATIATIRYTLGGKPAALPTSQVALIQWADTPEAFAWAQAAAARGDHDNAANLFLESAAQSERAAFKQDARFLGAAALLAGAGEDRARARAAADALTAWLADFPAGFRLPDAKLALGRALRTSGQHDAALQVLDQLIAAAVDQHWGVVWDARASLEKAMVQIAAGKTSDARSTLQSVVSKIDAELLTARSPDPELPDLRLRAVVAQGEAYVDEKDYDQALRYFAGLSGAAAWATRAAALAGEGEVMFLQATGDSRQATGDSRQATGDSRQATGDGRQATGDGRQATGERRQDVAKLRQAQARMAEAHVLDSANAGTSAKALYYSAKILLALGQSGEGDDYRARATDYFNIVCTEYATTRWAAAARVELKNK